MRQWKNEDGVTEHVIHTVPSWVYNKLRNPRIYDDRRTKVYNDKLKMPNFHLTPEEARRIAMVVVGLTKEKVAENRMAGLDAAQRLIEEGRKRRLAAQLPRVPRRRRPRPRHRVDYCRHEFPAAGSVARRRARAVAVPLQFPQRSDSDEDPAVARRADADLPLRR